MPVGGGRWPAILWTVQFLGFAPFAHAADVGNLTVKNLTGLPAYPNLDRAVMDGVKRTDALGHWCMRFWSDTSDSLSTVESWYRRSLAAASETDLAKDTSYKAVTSLSGIKLSSGLDYVAVYIQGSQARTSIDLYRCSPLK